MTEDEKLNYLVDNLSERIKDFFYGHSGEILIGEPEGYGDNIQIKITWIKELSVVKVCDYIFEKFIYDDTIECQPALYKAETMDQAWESAKTFVYDYLNDYLIDQEHIIDYTLEDGELQPDALDNYFEDLITWENYELYY